MGSIDSKRELMLNEKVEPLVCRMAVPTIITMLVSAFYNMADTYFVGQLDTISTAAVGLALPLMNVIQAIGFLFGHGSGNYMSRKLGSGDTDSAARMSDTAVLMSVIFGVLLSVLGFCFIEPLNILLGATPLLMEPSEEYLSILLLGVPFIMTAFTINNQLRFQGNAFKGMLGMASGSILNVILDPILIFGFDMKIAGAAWATVISQIVSFAVLAVISGRVPFRKPVFAFNAEIFGAIFKFGTPSLCRQGITSIATICMNNVAGLYGEAVIAAISVVNKIVMVGAFAVIGFGQGFQPVCGFNTGAGRYDRVKKMFLFCIKTTTVFMIIYSTAAFVLSGQLIAFFRDDPDVISVGIPILRFQCVSSCLQGIIVMTNMLMQNMGKTLTSSLLAVSRQGLFFIPLLYILAGCWGLFGVQITQAAADVLTAVVTIPFTVVAIRELNDKCRDMEALCESV